MTVFNEQDFRTLDLYGIQLANELQDAVILRISKKNLRALLSLLASLLRQK